MTIVRNGLARCTVTNTTALRVTAFQKRFAHPIGLAAGFDKNGEAIDEWENLGFSFVEIGTITPRPQQGNERPRLFRLPEDHALVNRMGFNNLGVHHAVEMLESRQTKLPIGANIGKNRSTPNEQAVNDYALCAKLLGHLVDFLVINVSSPNTPHLRDLQQPNSMKELILAVRYSAPETPAMVKLSPDLDDDSLKQLAVRCLEAGCAGFVATNTSIHRENLKSNLQTETGGLSGAPLRSRANEVCKLIRSEIGPEPTIIGVGGIATGADLKQRIDSGANLCQIYTSFVYRGPCAVRDILEEFVKGAN